MSWDVVVAVSREVFAEQHVDLPMELIFDGPVVAYCGEQLLDQHFARESRAAELVGGVEGLWMRARSTRPTVTWLWTPCFEWDEST